MSISNIAGTGIVIDLDIYTPQRPRPESPDFWHLQNQLRLQEWLRPFLPKMAYNQETNQVTASMVEDSKELLSYSTALTVDNMPLEDLAKLEKVVIELRTRITREEVEPDTKMLIENFSLPDPDSAPELYRVFGTPEHPRLAILWGMAKNGAPSIMLKDFSAARFLKGGGVTGKPRKRSKWLWILLLIAAAGIAYYTQSGSTPTETGETEPVTIPGTPPTETVTTEPVTIAAPDGTPHPASVQDTQGYPVSLQAETTEPARFVDTVGNPVDTAPGAAVKAYPNGLLTVTSDDGLETPVFVQTQSGEPVNAVVVKQDADGKPAATPVMMPARTETGKPVSNVRDSRGNHATICTDSPKPVRLVTPNGQPVPEDAEVKEEGDGMLSAIINGIKEFIFPETPAGDPVSAVVVTQGPDGKPAATPVMAPVRVGPEQDMPNIKGADGSPRVLVATPEQAKQGPATFVNVDGQKVPVTKETPMTEQVDGTLTVQLPGKAPETVYPVTGEGKPYSCTTVQSIPGKGLVTRKVVVVLVSREVPYTLDKTAEETLENGNVKVTFSIAPSHGSKLKSAKLNGQPVDLATGTVTVELNPSATKWVQVDVTTEDGRPHTNTHDIRFQQQ